MKTPKTFTGSMIEHHLHQQSAKCAPRSSSSSNWLGSRLEMRLGPFCLPVSRLAETASLVLGSRSMAQQPSAGASPALPVDPCACFSQVTHCCLALPLDGPDACSIVLTYHAIVSDACHSLLEGLTVCLLARCASIEGPTIIRNCTIGNNVRIGAFSHLEQVGLKASVLMQPPLW